MTESQSGIPLELITPSAGTVPAFVALWKSIPPGQRPGYPITHAIIDTLIASYEELERVRKTPGGIVIVHWPDGTTITCPVPPGQQVELRPKERT